MKRYRIFVAFYTVLFLPPRQGSSMEHLGHIKYSTQIPDIAQSILCLSSPIVCDILLGSVSQELLIASAILGSMSTACIEITE